MHPLSIPHGESVEQLLDQLPAFVDAAAALDDLALLASARCFGWSRVDAVVHVRVGVEEMLAGCVSPCDTVPDHDAASYWSSQPDERAVDPVPHILWLRRTASAYTRPSAAVRHLQNVAEVATRALARMPQQTVHFQGKVLTSGDFLATWVVELAIHHLDLDLDVDSRPPTAASLRTARRTLEAIAENLLPEDLDDQEALLVGLGRRPWPAGRPASTSFPITL